MRSLTVWETSTSEGRKARARSPGNVPWMLGEHYCDSAADRSFDLAPGQIR